MSQVGFDYDWGADPLTGGAYVASFPPGIMTSAKRAFHEEDSPILFAGSDIGPSWLTLVRT